MGTAAPSYALLFDGDCRVCRAFARAAEAIDVRGRVRARSLQESSDLLGSLAGDEILDAMRVVAPDGRVASGGDALPVLIEGLWGGPPLADLLGRSRLAGAGFRTLYEVLVELRGHLICRVGPVSGAPSPSRPS